MSSSELCSGSPSACRALSPLAAHRLGSGYSCFRRMCSGACRCVFHQVVGKPTRTRHNINELSLLRPSSRLARMSRRGMLPLRQACRPIPVWCTVCKLIGRLSARFIDRFLVHMCSQVALSKTPGCTRRRDSLQPGRGFIPSGASPTVSACHSPRTLIVWLLCVEMWRLEGVPLRHPHPAAPQICSART